MAPRALPHCWVHSVGVLSGVKLDSESIIIIRNYPALSTAIGGRDGMDGGGGHWMMRANYRTRHQLSPRRALPRCWAHLAGVSDGTKLYSAPIIIVKIYSALSLVVGGMDGGGRHQMML